jgi:hypothetical protein
MVRFVPLERADLNEQLAERGLAAARAAPGAAKDHDGFGHCVRRWRPLHARWR